ncbi:MAG: sugar phosphate isomerase/epimerase family protein [Fibrobacterota bacterium]
MKYAGFADEVSLDIDKQIEATKASGFDGIEMRMVGEKLHFDDAEEYEFQKIREKISEAGLEIPSYGSQIANWSRKITDDISKDKDELLRIIPRMHETNTGIVRIMSYPNDGLSDSDWRDEVVNRLKELSKIAEDGGIILAHENCNGWGGESPENSIEMIERVGSRALKLIFDTGNTVQHFQDSLDFFKKVKEHVIHLHVKDFKNTPEGHKACFPGEGEGSVPEVISILKKDGFKGWISIEPHIAAVAHEGKNADDEKESRDIYIKYANMTRKIYESA